MKRATSGVFRPGSYLLAMFCRYLKRNLACLLAEMSLKKIWRVILKIHIAPRRHIRHIAKLMPTFSANERKLQMLEFSGLPTVITEKNLNFKTPEPLNTRYTFVVLGKNF
jgi:hypothetical protein